MSHKEMLTVSTLVDLVRWRADRQPDHPIYTFLAEGETPEGHLTHEQLDVQARAIAVELQERGIRAGERALLLYPPGLAYIAAFFGCLYAGVIAVPAYPPRLNRPMSRIHAIAGDAQAAVALTTTAILDNLVRRLSHEPLLAAIKWVATDSVEALQSDLWRPPDLTRETIAFLQYTSGSTAVPKGVMVTHGNLLSNERMIQHAFAHTEDSTFVGWLPLYHDMGLIGNVLQPLYIGSRAILMSPLAFLQRPYRWLHAISHYRAWTSGAPNFAYSLCVHKISPEERQTLDLSSWRVAFNGAEPIRWETLALFTQAFEPYGFRREAFYPCYGLAEATLFVSGGLAAKPPVADCVAGEALARHEIVPIASCAGERSQMIVGCGRNWLQQQILIVNPETAVTCPVNQVGEIWISGPNVAKGYWRRPEITQEVFAAHLADGTGPFLRTGDLGYMRDGELYITGRLKDLIILRGRNYYPQDIELSAEKSHEALRPGCTAAFSVPEQDEEQLVIVQELQRSYHNYDLDEVAESIRQNVSQTCELAVYAVAFIKAGSIPKTSSGKIQRRLTRKLFLEGALELVSQYRFAGAVDTLPDAFDTASGPGKSTALNQAYLEDYLRRQIAHLLKLPPSQLSRDRDISEIGLDSLQAVTLQHGIETDFGVAIPLTSFLEEATISEVASQILTRQQQISAGEQVVNVAATTQLPDTFPLSRGQQSLYFLHQFAPNSRAYNIARAVRLSDTVDLVVLQEAFTRLIARRPMLRANFYMENGVVRQRLQQQSPASLQIIDQTTVPESEWRAQLHAIANYRFDLERDSLIQSRVFKVAAGDAILLLVVHHIIVDLWSISLLIDELSTLYRAIQTGEEAPLRPLPATYADYVRWQESLLRSVEGERLWAYWRHYLAAPLPTLNLPTDFTRAAVNQYQGARRTLLLDKDLTQQIKNIAQTNKVTLHMTLLAAFQCLLYRYTGQESFLLGTLTTGRSRASFTNLIGYFANPLPLRATISGNETFTELLAQVRRGVLDLFRHQDFPFATLVEKIQPERDPSLSPLFQVLFVFQKTMFPRDRQLVSFALGEAGAELDMGSFSFTTLPVEVEGSQFDLTLTMGEGQDGLLAAMDYNTGLFKPSTIERMLDHFYCLLQAIAAHPDQPVAYLPLLTEVERESLQRTAGNQQQYPVAGQTVVSWFEKQAAATPYATAVTFQHTLDGSHEVLTYSELNQRANQLAHYLKNKGVGPDTLVAVCLHRSSQMVVALLAILKAGGAYVPMDPHYPAERLDFMLVDTEAALLVTEAAIQPTLPTHQVDAVCLDQLQAELATYGTQNPHTDLDSQNLAYVIYTSGSTGTPKGVAVTHANVLRLLRATQAWFHFDEQDVWTFFHSYAFDFSVWEIWGCLLYGGRLVIVPYLLSRTPDAFYRLLDAEKVTVLNQTPSAFRQLTHAAERIAAAPVSLALRLIIFGGEALELESLRPWVARHGNQHPQLINMYGITETTVHVTYAPITSLDVMGSPIGQPIPDLDLYLLDAHNNLVPAGAAGEIYVGGAGLARGYWRRPALTATRFVPHPFSSKPGARLYRTGDLARYGAEGELLYLGRGDNQVKIRGHRIELGEIEAVLCRHPEVQEGVVLARSVSNEETEKVLIAYIVARRELPPDSLRTHLNQWLPGYMLPAHYVQLATFPLTANGKVDRAALPSPTPQRPALSTPYVPPRNRYEEILVSILASVLSLERVGIDDNFFELGGDSIRSIQVVAAGEEQGLPLSLAQIFRYQTVRQLAQQLSVAGEQTDVDAAVTAQFSLITDADREKLPDDVSDAYPLSQLQAGLVFHSEFSANYEIYVTSFYIQARFDEESWRKALQQMATQHPILRTAFMFAASSEPLQVVYETAEITLHVADISHLLPEAQETMLADWVAREQKRKFDWSKAPLFRFYIHRRSPETFQFSMAEPFLDGWSVALLVTELLHRYAALLQGETAVYPPLQLSYRDFIALEQEALRSSAHQEFWARQLQGYTQTRIARWPQPLTSPQSLHQRVLVPIPDELLHGAQAVAQSLSVPLKSVLLAAHCRVVSLISGQSDVVTGLIANGRPEQAGGDRIIGLFLNTLPLRVKLSGGTWADLVRHLFQLEQETLPFRRYPLAQMQREQGGENLFETAFNFTHFHLYQNLKTLANLEVLAAQTTDQTYFGLTAYFNLDVLSGSLYLSLDCDMTILCEDQIEAVREYYLRTLSAISQQPDGRYEYTPLLPPPEQTRLRHEWNATGLAYAPDRYVHQQFAAQAVQTPAAVAVKTTTQTLTYKQLNQQANHLAHHLQALGVGPELPVALCLDRSAAMVVALLAVLKAGGVYVPLDPAYPQERLAYIMADSQAPVLITEERYADLLSVSPMHVVLMDTWQKHALAGQDDPVVGLHPENLAYLIYTSGSTGKPKGVQVPHRALTNFLEAMKQQPGMARTDTLLAVTTLSFDIAALELFLPLVTGGCVALVDPVVAGDGSLLAEAIDKVEATIMQATPATYRLLLAAGWSGRPQLRVLCGGEALPPDLAEALRPKCAALWNMYGPTETTVWSALHSVVAHDGQRDTAVPIGHPLANTQIYILDAHMQPVPTGVPGELYIGGDGLSRGYYKQAALTAARFVPNPFFMQSTLAEDGLVPPSAFVLYRTGDLARWLPTGTLEFLGRIDQQVKIRGHRIEIGEVEAALAQHPDVRVAAVVVRQVTERLDDKQLVAFWVAATDAALADDALRLFLRQRLPGYMIPAVFVQLQEMPLTPNGKIDRRALPDVELTRPALIVEYAPPQTSTEQALALIWAETLHLEKIGIHDNFFELGGHSLTATQLAARLRIRFPVQLPLQVLFERPTIAELAAYLDALQEIDHLPLLSTIPSRSQDEPQPLSFAQQRLWFLDQLAPGNVFYNLATAVRLQGKLNLNVLAQSFQLVVQRHESLRTRFVVADMEPVQKIDTVNPFKLQIVDLRHLSSADREIESARQLTCFVRRPFDLSRSSLFRVALLQCEEEDAVLLVSMHHIVSDGWSIGILIREVAALYAALADAKETSLPKLPIQYTDYARWQRQQLQDGLLQEHLAYWQTKLSAPLPTLQLPFAQARAHHQYLQATGAKYTHKLPPALATKLRTWGQEQKATLFMTLLAGFKALLYGYTGQTDMMVGTDAANRNYTEIENLVGFFVNQLVLRTQVTAVLSFREFVQTVRRTTLEAYAHQELPFDKLVEALNPERSLDYAPIFQIKFISMNVPIPELTLPGLRLIPMEVDTGMEEMDLRVSVYENEEPVRMVWRFNNNLFEEAAIQQMASDYVFLLQEAMAAPDTPLRALTAHIARVEIQRKKQANIAKLKDFKPKPVDLE